MDLSTSRLIGLAERGMMPDPVIRRGIRSLLRKRLRSERHGGCEGQATALAQLLSRMRAGPVAVDTGKANEQHYELPPEFFRSVLGPRLKYSCCHWRAATRSLAEAEEEMLRLTCDRAGVADGMDVLDLGCGWGSQSIWIAENHPACRVVSVSNSLPQIEFIRRECARRGLTNVEPIQADMNDFSPERRFNRIVSVEMFEHMRNYQELLRRVAQWLQPGGKLFVHVFCHRQYAYLFRDEGAADWMARHFFTGGLMPSDSLLLYFQDHLKLTGHWRVNGRHYEKTLRAWLATLDGRRATILPILESTYGAQEAERWFHRWRLFFLACAELFGYRQGEEWWVAHYLLEPRR